MTKRTFAAAASRSRKLVKEEIDGRNLAVSRDDEIGSRVSRRLARAARHPTNPPPIAHPLRRGERLISEVRMSSLDHAGDAVDLVATAVNAVGLVEYGVFVEDLVDRFASAHGINLSEHVMEVAKQTRSIQCRTWFFSDWCQAAVALPPRSSRPRFCCFALVATWHNASFKAGRECRSLAPFDPNFSLGKAHNRLIQIAFFFA